MSEFSVGDYVVVRGEIGEPNARRFGKVLEVLTPSYPPLVMVEFKEGEIVGLKPDQLEATSLTVYIPGDFVTILDIDIYDKDQRLVATPGDPAIVLEHNPKDRLVQVGVMRTPDDRPYEFWITESNVEYRERWDR